MIRYRTLRAHAAEVLSQVGMADLRPEQYIRDLGVGQQQLVEIAAGLSRRCRLLILDEPTAALTQRETDLLFAQISRLKATGASILYISHRMEEIKRVADRITVLRDGCLIAAHDAARVNIDQIIAQMVGRELGQSVYRARPRGDVALSVRNLSRGSAVRDVSFEVHRGEILGIAGLMGSGRTEMVRAIFGADRPDQGEIRLSDRPVRIRSPRDAVRHGLALLTEDRKAQGLLLPMPIRANATLARLRPLARLGGWLSGRRETSAARSLVVRLGIRCHGVEQPVLTLSGGNQQKVVIAKWLWRDCGVLIFDEPTRGIDVGARFEIYRLLLELAAAGKAIVIVCSDLVELLSVCDRIAVMSAGRLVQTFDRGQWTADAIMAAALSQYVNP
jgi:ribose transport system ATP-binding protein